MKRGTGWYGDPPRGEVWEGGAGGGGREGYPLVRPTWVRQIHVALQKLAGLPRRRALLFGGHIRHGVKMAAGGAHRSYYLIIYFAHSTCGQALHKRTPALLSHVES